MTVFWSVTVGVGDGCEAVGLRLAVPVGDRVGAEGVQDLVRLRLGDVERVGLQVPVGATVQETDSELVVVCVEQEEVSVRLRVRVMVPDREEGAVREPERVADWLPVGVGDVLGAQLQLRDRVGDHVAVWVTLGLRVPREAVWLRVAVMVDRDGVGDGVGAVAETVPEKESVAEDVGVAVKDTEAVSVWVKVCCRERVGVREDECETVGVRVPVWDVAVSVGVGVGTRDELPVQLGVMLVGV